MRLLGFIRRVVLKYSVFLFRSINHLRLKNKTFTLLSNDCIGGVISHNCKVRFLSPTVNLYFPNIEEYIIFWEHISVYRDLPVIEDVSSPEDYPVGILQNAEYGDIHIHFMHYETFADAVDSWKKRCERINLENTYAILHLSFLPEKCEELLSRFSKLSFKGKCLISWPNILPKNLVWKDSLFILPYTIINEPGKILEMKNFFGKRYIDDFDYVAFLNGKTIIKVPEKK